MTRLSKLFAELLAGLDTFESAMVREDLGGPIGCNSSSPQIPLHLESHKFEGEGEDPDSEFTDELDPSEPDTEAGGGEMTTGSDEEYDEWTGFGHGWEVDENTVPSPTKPLESAVVTQTRQPGSKYVPPHLRKTSENAPGQPSENLVKLTKQLKGLLNRYAGYLFPPPRSR